MKKGKFMLIVGTAAWCATATFGSNPLPEDTMYAVRRMLRFAHANPRDTFIMSLVTTLLAAALAVPSMPPAAPPVTDRSPVRV